MADFNLAFEQVIKAEGGYVNDPDDPGGETYKGVARLRNPKWTGWVNVDLLKDQSGFPKNLDADDELQQHIKTLYQINYWDKVQGDLINDQDIAESIFDFAVNAGPRTSSMLAQQVAQTAVDGVIGPKTLNKINKDDKRAFLAVFALMRISRYVDIVEGRPTSRKFLYGWIKRTLSDRYR